jgi:putative transcriptional regulator
MRKKNARAVNDGLLIEGDMTAKRKTNDRLTRELLEMAKGMHASGVMNDAAYEKITMRHLHHAGASPEPLTGDDIRAMREQARMSQAVFARLLNLTSGYVSQLERGTKRPTGAALVLLDVIRRKGIDAIL